MDTFFFYFALTFLTLHAISTIYKKISSPSVSCYCSRNNRDSFTPPIHRATLAVTPGDFCSKLPETFERDIVSRGVSVRGWELKQYIKLGILVKKEKDLLVFNLNWITIATLCAMTENSVLNSKVNSVKQIGSLLINTYFLPCIYLELILILVIQELSIHLPLCLKVGTSHFTFGCLRVKHGGNWD